MWAPSYDTITASKAGDMITKYRGESGLDPFARKDITGPIIEWCLKITG